MSLRKECSDCKLIKKIRDFVTHNLNEKEKIILNEAAKNNTNVTKLVSFISKEYGFSKTSVWYNLKKLKEADMVTFGDQDKKGIHVKVTFLGSLIHGGEKK